MSPVFQIPPSSSLNLLDPPPKLSNLKGLRRHSVAQASELCGIGWDEAEDGGDEVVIWDGSWGARGRGGREGVGGKAEGGEEG